MCFNVTQSTQKWTWEITFRRMYDIILMEDRRSFNSDELCPPLCDVILGVDAAIYSKISEFRAARRMKATLIRPEEKIMTKFEMNQYI